jgi:predicted transcriptional regulator
MSSKSEQPLSPVDLADRVYTLLKEALAEGDGHMTAKEIRRDLNDPAIAVRQVNSTLYNVLKKRGRVDFEQASMPPRWCAVVDGDQIVVSKTCEDTEESSETATAPVVLPMIDSSAGDSVEAKAPPLKDPIEETIDREVRGVLAVSDLDTATIKTIRDRLKKRIDSGWLIQHKELIRSRIRVLYQEEAAK